MARNLKIMARNFMNGTTLHERPAQVNDGNFFQGDRYLLQNLDEYLTI